MEIKNFKEFKKTTKKYILLKEEYKKEFVGWFSYNDKKEQIRSLFGTNGVIAYAIQTQNRRLRGFEEFLLLTAKCKANFAVKKLQKKIKEFSYPSWYDEFDDECPEGFATYQSTEELAEELIPQYNSLPCVNYYDKAIELAEKANSILIKLKK